MDSTLSENNLIHSSYNHEIFCPCETAVFDDYPSLPLVSLLAAPGRNADDPPRSVRLPEESKVAFLGLLATKLSPVVGSQLGLPANLYLSVAMVSPDGPSEKAGLMQYDILKKLDDQILVNPEQLVELVRSKKIGQEVSPSILRVGEKTLKVALGAKKAWHRRPV